MRKGFARSIAVAIIGGLLLASASGCTALNMVSNSDAEQQVSSEISPDIETQWEEAKEDSKKQITDWYKANVASDETIKNLWEHGRDETNSWNLHFCVLENNVPLYNIPQFIQVSEMIADYMTKLEDIDPNSFASAEQIEETIAELQNQCGIKINADGSNITFENVSTFEEDEKNNVEEVYAVTDRPYPNGNRVYFMTSYDLVKKAQQNGREVYTIRYFLDSETIEESIFDYSIFGGLENDDTLAYNNITWYMQRNFDKYRITLLRNDEEINVNRVLFNDILEACYPIFADNKEYVSICNERGITPDN